VFSKSAGFASAVLFDVVVGTGVVGTDASDLGCWVFFLGVRRVTFVVDDVAGRPAAAPRALKEGSSSLDTLTKFHAGEEAVVVFTCVTKAGRILRFGFTVARLLVAAGPPRDGKASSYDEAIGSLFFGVLLLLVVVVVVGSVFSK